VKVVDLNFYSVPKSSRVLSVFSTDDEAVVQFGGGVTGKPQVEIAVNRWGNIRRTVL
jgi:hypothetical protein